MQILILRWYPLSGGCWGVVPADAGVAAVDSTNAAPSSLPRASSSTTMW